MSDSLERLRNQAKVAKEFDAAKVALRMGLPGAEELVEHVHKKYRKALQEYIDPFKVNRNWD